MGGGISMPNGRIERWITTDEGNHLPIVDGKINGGEKTPGEAFAKALTGNPNEIDYNERIRDIPEWYLSKKLDSNQLYATRVADDAWVAKETEKAFLVNWSTEYGKVSAWVPKSLVSDENIKKAKDREINFIKKAESGLSYNKKLVELGKANGVKGVRNRLKTSTLEKLLRDASIELPKR